MPIKRRAAKGRKQIDELELEDLFYGPGSCLLNGCGYLGPHNDVDWRDATPDVKAAVLAAMREDWERQWPFIMNAWRNRSPHDLWCARQHYGDPAQPWALTEFGELK